MVESVISSSQEAYVPKEKAETLLTGSFEHSQGLQQVQELLAIGINILYKDLKIDPDILSPVASQTEQVALGMHAGEVHGEFHGIDPHREPIFRLRDMIQIVNTSELPATFYNTVYTHVPSRYQQPVTQENLQIPPLEQADWVWYGILSYMVERDSYYICPDEDGNVRGRPGNNPKKDTFDSQFCRLILQQDNAYTPEYTKVMQQVRAFLRRELPLIQAHEPELYAKMEAVIKQYNVLPHKQEIRQASLDQLQEADKE